MENRILQKKLQFLHHLATLPKGTLARDFYDQQKEHNLPGLICETKGHLQQFGVNDVDQYSKYQWNKIIKQNILLKNKNELLAMSQKYKKIDITRMENELFQVQPYFKTLSV